MEIRHSARRKKTLEVRYEGDQLVAMLPSDLSEEVASDAIARLVRRCVAARAQRAQREDRDLGSRAEALADCYLTGVRAADIRWVTNQNNRWGSCSPATGAIRISARLARVPDWVLDSVLVHELAHLIEPNHSARFRALTARYPRTAEAGTFLEGYGLGLRAREAD